MDFELLHELMVLSLKKEKALILAAMHEREFCSVAFFIRFNNRITYIKGASSSFGRKVGSMHMLFNQVIKQNSNNSIFLDFGGSMHPGISKFFESFTATKKNYSSIHNNSLPFPINILKK